MKRGSQVVAGLHILLFVELSHDSAETAEVRPMSEVRLVVQALDRLGEGPLWDASAGRLYWFDIKGQRLNFFEPATDGRGTFDLPVRASAAAVRASGGLLMATEKGLAVMDPVAGTVAIVEAFDLGHGFRT